jgi:hypothetical protein
MNVLCALVRNTICVIVYVAVIARPIRPETRSVTGIILVQNQRDTLGDFVVINSFKIYFIKVHISSDFFYFIWLDD